MATCDGWRCCSLWLHPRRLLLRLQLRSRLRQRLLLRLRSLLRLGRLLLQHRLLLLLDRMLQRLLSTYCLQGDRVVEHARNMRLPASQAAAVAAAAVDSKHPLVFDY